MYFAGIVAAAYRFVETVYVVPWASYYYCFQPYFFQAWYSNFTDPGYMLWYFAGYISAVVVHHFAEYKAVYRFAFFYG